jgi:signal transduction histidine kinase
VTLRQRLAFRYLGVVAVCLLLLAGLAYHEFVVEPRVRQEMGFPKPSGSTWGEYAEMFCHGMIPVVLGVGWWLLRKTLAPISHLTHSVEEIHAGNLRQPLPRSHSGDEVDRLTEAFNATTARLDQSFQQIRQFTLHASHEWKTPLTAMRLHLETAFREAESRPAEQPQWMFTQLEEIQRLTRIVDGLTLLTKADAGLVTLEKRPVRLSQLVRETFDDTAVLAEAHDIQVTLTDCEELVVLGDPDRLRQALLNLADNAVKYNRDGGSVRMALRRTGNGAEIEINNTGGGIPAELQPRLFERFERGNDALSKAVEGCGLGLAIVQRIVQGHGGTVRILSEPGKLTTALLRLPAAPPASAAGP